MPQLLILWTIAQNNLVPIDGWLNKFQATWGVGLRVSVAGVEDRRCSRTTSRAQVPGLGGRRQGGRPGSGVADLRGRAIQPRAYSSARTGPSSGKVTPGSPPARSPSLLRELPRPADEAARRERQARRWPWLIGGTWRASRSRQRRPAGRSAAARRSSRPRRRPLRGGPPRGRYLTAVEDALADPTSSSRAPRRPARPRPSRCCGNGPAPWARSTAERPSAPWRRARKARAPRTGRPCQKKARKKAERGDEDGAIADVMATLGTRSAPWSTSCGTSSRRKALPPSSWPSPSRLARYGRLVMSSDRAGHQSSRSACMRSM